MLEPIARKVSVAVLAFAVCMTSAPGLATVAQARTIGMVADDATDSVVVFDADTNAVLGSVAVGPGLVGDCSVTSDQRLGFVTDFAGLVWVVDLAASPPTLAQPDPIRISNPGEDTSLSHDDRFLVVCDGITSDPISVIDVATRTEVSSFFLGSSCSSVDVCRDGSVLVASSSSGRVHRLLLGEDGTLTDTGEQIFTGAIGWFGPNNVHCAPDAASGVVVMRDPGRVLSFRMPGLEQVDERPLSGSGSGISGEITSSGSIFLRSEGGAVDRFAFDSTTGELGATPLLTLGVAAALPFFGIDQLALDPSQGRLYVSQPGALAVYDGETGSLSGAIFHEQIVSPNGVCFPRATAARCGDGIVDDGEECDDGNTQDGDGCSSLCTLENAQPDCSGAFPSVDRLWPAKGQMEEVTIEGVTDVDGSSPRVTITAIMQNEPVTDRRSYTCPDAVGLGQAVARLRAERAPNGNGRLYDLSFLAEGAEGGQCAGTVRVCVPAKAKGPKSACPEEATRFDSSVCP